MGTLPRQALPKEKAIFSWSMKIMKTNGRSQTSSSLRPKDLLELEMNLNLKVQLWELSITAAKPTIETSEYFLFQEKCSQHQQTQWVQRPPARTQLAPLPLPGHHGDVARERPTFHAPRSLQWKTVEPVPIGSNRLYRGESRDA